MPVIPRIHEVEDLSLKNNKSEVQAERMPVQGELTGVSETVKVFPLSLHTEQIGQ